MSQPQLPGGIDLSELLEQANQQTQVKSKMEINLTGVRVLWGGGITQAHQIMITAKIESLDGSMSVTVPMSEQYFKATIREANSVYEQVQAMEKRMQESDNGSNPGE
jgi:acetate kinase